MRREKGEGREVRRGGKEGGAERGREGIYCVTGSPKRNKFHLFQKLTF